ncbi:MAG: YceI family protein [Flavobacteriaceae bacterium]
MKKTLLNLFLSTSLLLGVQLLEAQEKTIDTAQSSIHWVGKKVTGQHEGNIQLKSGSLLMDQNQVTGGRFSVDMTTISCTDLQGKSANNLVGHLKSDDFFSVATYPLATLTFTQVKQKAKGVYAVTGDFTIKGITHPASFELQLNNDTATAKVVIDRSKYNVRYGSNSFFDNLGNKAIYDNFELDVTLKM